MNDVERKESEDINKLLVSAAEAANLMSKKQIEKLLIAKELAKTKESLGEILLILQCTLTPKEQQDLLQFFELLLERYVEEKMKE